MDMRVKYRQIAAGLRAQIAQGTLRPGDPVPSEADLARQWDVARMTARAALQELEQAGLLLPGRPRRVARHEPLAVHVARTADYTWPGESPTAGADAWVGDMHRAGQDIAQHIEVVTTMARPEVARRLGVGDMDVVTARRLVREAGGRPHNLIMFWFPRDVAEGTLLASPASIKEGSVAWLEKTRGPLAHEVEVSARMPEPGEVSLLHIPGGIPVMIVWRVSRTMERPVMCSMAVYPADRAKLRLSL